MEFSPRGKAMVADSVEKGGISIVVGLGNPGPEYEDTRHNVGFAVLDQMVKRFQVPMRQRLFQASWGKVTIGERSVCLVKPLTYMNRSGEAVGSVLRYFKKSPGQLLVIHDDLDLPLGRVKIVPKGGSGGHRGIDSIIRELGSRDFPRVKLGIGRPQYGEPVETYVLAPPYEDQREGFEKMLGQGMHAVLLALEEGMERAMNRFNERPRGSVGGVKGGLS